MTGYDENMVVYFCERVTRHLLQVGRNSSCNRGTDKLSDHVRAP